MDEVKTEAPQQETRKPNVKDSRVLTYLNMYQNEPAYKNTKEEEILTNLWRTKFLIAEQEFEKTHSNSQNLKVWREMAKPTGQIKMLNSKGVLTDETQAAIDMTVFELIEEKVNALIPAVKMNPNYQADIIPVEASEKMIMHIMDKILTKEKLDEIEHATLIDGTCWTKIEWNPFRNTSQRSGMPEMHVCPVDSVFPQPGVHNWQDLEYIFERKTMSVAQARDYFGRNIPSPDYNDLVKIIFVYYLNENRQVGRFAFEERYLICCCNDLEWGMRRRRECTKCHKIEPRAAQCDACGSKEFTYIPVQNEKLKTPLVSVENPYLSGQDDDPANNQNVVKEGGMIPEGTEIPHYLICQLPFVPRRNYKVPGSIYGISEVALSYVKQDANNKLLNKALDKSAGSRTWITKSKDTNIEENPGKSYSYVETDDPKDANLIGVHQIMADMTGEVALAELFYGKAKSVSGVTDTDQGKNDPSARSGKAKQMQMAASAERKVSPARQRDSHFAAMYNLIFKYMLAFCDDDQSFVSVLPNGQKQQQQWSKYMFLTQDDAGKFYYRDDYSWSVDTASNITQDRSSMWQMIKDDFMIGIMGTEVDPMRALAMFWHMMEMNGYPTAKFATAFLEDSVQHLPSQIEQMLVQNPEAVQLALSFIQDMQKANGLGGTGTGQGGARDGAGAKGKGQTHAQGVGKTNETNRAKQGGNEGQGLPPVGGPQ